MLTHWTGWNCSQVQFLKKLLHTVFLALFGLILLSQPLGAEYLNKEAQKHFENGMIYIRQGYQDLVIRELEHAAKLEPQAPDAHRYLAVAYSLKFQVCKAIDSYDKLFKANPNINEVPPIKAHWLEQDKITRMLASIKAELERVHLERPEAAVVHAMLAWLYGEEGKLRDAYDELLHAQELAHITDKHDLAEDNKPLATLLLELVTAMQSSPSLAETQVGLLLYALNNI